jgi:hypothetical protein
MAVRGGTASGGGVGRGDGTLAPILHVTPPLPSASPPTPPCPPSPRPTSLSCSPRESRLTSPCTTPIIASTELLREPPPSPPIVEIPVQSPPTATPALPSPTPATSSSPPPTPVFRAPPTPPPIGRLPTSWREVLCQKCHCDAHDISYRYCIECHFKENGYPFYY